MDFTRKTEYGDSEFANYYAIAKKISTYNISIMYV